jgi:hypothetical protein
VVATTSGRSRRKRGQFVVGKVANEQNELCVYDWWSLNFPLGTLGYVQPRGNISLSPLVIHQVSSKAVEFTSFDVLVK